MKKKPSAISLIFILLLISCGSPDEKEIEEILSKRKNAFETKNVNLYLSCIDPGYREEKKGKVIGIKEIKKNFLSNVSIFDRIKLSHFDRSIYTKGKKAEVVQKTKVEVILVKEESRFLLKENLDFEKINGKWVIVKESETDFLRGFVFGGG